MKIHTEIVFDIQTGAVLKDTFYEYHGPVDLLCGAAPAQTAALGSQTSITNQIMQQGQQVFGQSSQVFNDLTSSLAPTVAAGPNQQGFSAAENSAMQSAAITNGGTAYKNAKAATGDALASQSGGNNPSTTSGTTAGIDANLASSAASNTANQLNQITQANYATGRQNYDTAASDLAGAPGVFNASTNLDNSASSAAAGEAETANNIASQNNSWMSAVTGALGTVAGAAVGDIPTGGSSSSSSGTNFANFNSAVANGNDQTMSVQSSPQSNTLL